MTQEKNYPDTGTLIRCNDNVFDKAVENPNCTNYKRHLLHARKLRVIS